MSRLISKEQTAALECVLPYIRSLRTGGGGWGGCPVHKEAMETLGLEMTDSVGDIAVKLADIMIGLPRMGDLKIVSAGGGNGADGKVI